MLNKLGYVTTAVFKTVMTICCTVHDDSKNENSNTSHHRFAVYQSSCQ